MTGDPEVAILCGGRGRRLGKRTESIPKALVPLNGRPILDYVLAFYRSKGFSQFVLCVGYKAEQVVAHYVTAPEGEMIQFSNVGEDASMLERIWALRDVVTDRLIVSYCDTFIDLDLERLLQTHLGNKAVATIVTAEIRNPFGLVTADSQGWVTSFVEKPMLNYYIGSFVIEKSAFESITPDMLAQPDGEGLVNLFCLLSEQQRLGAFAHTGTQITFNTESERRRAEEDLGRFYTFKEDE